MAIKKGVIADKYQNNPSVIEEFFPHGLNEFSRVSKKGADTLFKRFITTLEAHKSDFDPSMVTEANDKYNAYVDARKVQLQKIGRVKDETATASDKRSALELQLFKNLLTIVLINADDPSKASNYFDFSLLKKKSKKAPLVKKDAAVK